MGVVVLTCVGVGGTGPIPPHPASIHKNSKLIKMMLFFPFFAMKEVPFSERRSTAYAVTRTSSNVGPQGGGVRLIKLRCVRVSDA